MSGRMLYRALPWSEGGRKGGRRREGEGGRGKEGGGRRLKEIVKKQGKMEGMKEKLCKWQWR